MEFGFIVISSPDLEMQKAVVGEFSGFRVVKRTKDMNFLTSDYSCTRLL